eukprot:GHVN01056780.1.p1 GENE.GHVN01056780.1~~GHVN01056780.1.p1  ORF type:complete len:409 (-),score=35.42 GHVN01056780.1:1576-2802(-)
MQFPQELFPQVRLGEVLLWQRSCPSIKNVFIVLVMEVFDGSCRCAVFTESVELSQRTHHCDIFVIPRVGNVAPHWKSISEDAPQTSMVEFYCYGVLGLVEVAGKRFLLLVSTARLVGSLLDAAIFQMNGVEWIPLFPSVYRVSEHFGSLQRNDLPFVPRHATFSFSPARAICPIPPVDQRKWIGYSKHRGEFSESWKESKAELCFYEMFNKTLSCAAFFFSDTMDLTTTIRQSATQACGNRNPRSNCVSSMEETGTEPKGSGNGHLLTSSSVIAMNADEYCWNLSFLKLLEKLSPSNAFKGLRLIEGFAQIISLDIIRPASVSLMRSTATPTVTAESSPHLERSKDDTSMSKDSHLNIVLISRRLCRRVGRRFLCRGVDLDGDVSNFVTTEQILVRIDVGPPVPHPLG